jgi:Ca-activated chloride channel homolog
VALIQSDGHPAAVLPDSPSGRHRQHRRRLGMKVGVGATVLAVLIGAGWMRGSFGSASPCSGGPTLRMAAAPEIAPAVQAAAQTWNEQHKGGGCVNAAVVASDPADTAQTVAGDGHTLTGLTGTRNLPRPDVWIPDSSMWLQRIHKLGADLVPEAAPSVARSPVVLGVPQPVAERLGWPTKSLTWAALLERMTTGSGLRTGMVDPARDAPSLSALLALQNAAPAIGPQAQTATVGSLRTLASNRSAVAADLLARFPRASDQTALSTGLAAAPLSEQAVIAFDAAQPPVPLVPMYVSPQPAPLDYPYTVLPHPREGVADLAQEFLKQLQAADFKDVLARHGLRAADGSTGANFAATAGTPATLTLSGRVDAAEIDRTLNTWGVISQPGRLLAVIDVSGSMKSPVPTAGGKSREQVTVEAAAGGLGLFGDDWSVGLWTFSTKLNGDAPFRELAPIAPLASRRAAVSQALGAVAPTNGDTGLYDTILAAYRDVQSGWDPGRSNAVVVLTDGQNDNPAGLNLDQLLSELRRIADPHRKIQVIAVGIGEADRTELTAITKVTGGGVFIAADPSQIGDIFLQAIALRPHP